MPCMNEWMYERMKGLNKNLINTLSAIAYIKHIFQQSMYQPTFLPHGCTHVQQLKICYQSLCWITASLTLCLTGTHTYTHIHIHAIKSPTKVLRSPSLYDCTSCIGGFFLHPIACLYILAWLCIIQAEENNHQYSFCNGNLTMKWNQKWNTGFIPNVGCFTSYLAES